MVKQSWVKCVTLPEPVCFDGPSSLRQHDIHYVNFSRGLMLGLPSSKMTIKQKHTATRLRLNTAKCWWWRLSQANKTKEKRKHGEVVKHYIEDLKIALLSNLDSTSNISSRLELELGVLTAGYLQSCIVHSFFTKQKEISRKVILLSQGCNHLSWQGRKADAWWV